jgi:hypothetical protein
VAEGCAAPRCCTAPAYNLLKFKGFCASGEKGTYLDRGPGLKKGDMRNAIEKETSHNTPKKTNHPDFDANRLELPVNFARVKRAISTANASPT